MSKLQQQFEEDRAIKNAARRVLLTDFAHAKTALSAKGLANRIGGRVGDGAKDIFYTVKLHADDNRGILAALIGAVIIWFARAPIMEILGIGSSHEHDDNDTEAELVAISENLNRLNDNE